MTATNLQTAPFAEQVRALIEDPLRVARDHARAGGRVVAYLGNDVPVALILAAGALPARLRGVARGATPLADRYLESAHSPELRALVEQWLTRDLDFIESVVFPRSDDSAQRLYYYLCELQRRGVCAGPRPLLFDVASINRPMSVEYTRESTRRLARDLGTNDAGLPDALRRVATREDLLREIRARRTRSAALPGTWGWQLDRAGACDWRETFDEAAHRWLADAPEISGVRLLLAGDPPPDAQIHEAIERANGNVILELTESAADPYRGDPRVEALADHFHSRRAPVIAMREDSHWAVRQVRDAQADAVVFWLIEEDESLPWEIARQMRHLTEAGVPALLLTRQSWRVDPDALRRLHEFISMLESRK